MAIPVVDLMVAAPRRSRKNNLQTAALVFVAKQHDFTAVNCDASSAVFDGRGDHAGEHLTYKRSGDSLLIIGDFLHYGTPSRMEWRMTRAAIEAELMQKRQSVSTATLSNAPTCLEKRQSGSS